MPPTMYESMLVNMPEAPGGHSYNTVPTVVTTQPSAGAAAQVEAACFTEVDDATAINQRSCEYDGKDMTAIIKLLDFLESRLNTVSVLLIVNCVPVKDFAQKVSRLLSIKKKEKRMERICRTERL